jgi:hypothetical protein
VIFSWLLDQNFWSKKACLFLAIRISDQVKSNWTVDFIAWSTYQEWETNATIPIPEKPGNVRGSKEKDLGVGLDKARIGSIKLG